MAPEVRTEVGGCAVHLVGTIAGFVPDAARVEAAIAARPACVALGVPTEDLEALEALHDAPERHEEFPEMDAWTERFFELLAPWGEMRIPSPDFDAAYAGARAAGIPIEAIDIDDEDHTALHTKHMKMRHIIAMNHRRNRLLGQTIEATDAYDLAAKWDALDHRGRPLRRVQEEREAKMAEALRRLAKEHASIVAIVPAPRLPGIVAWL